MIKLSIIPEYGPRIHFCLKITKNIIIRMKNCTSPHTHPLWQHLAWLQLVLDVPRVNCTHVSSSWWYVFSTYAQNIYLPNIVWIQENITMLNKSVRNVCIERISLSCCIRWQDSGWPTFSRSKMSLCFMINTSTVLYLCMNGGNLSLKCDHKYYFQIQGQKFCAEKRACDLIIFTMKDLEVIIIEIDKKVIKMIKEINFLHQPFRMYVV